MIPKILRILRNRPQLAETVFIPLFWALYFVYLLFRGKQFILAGFPDRPISIASFDGVDVTERVRTFYYAIGLSLLLFVGLLFAIQKLLHRLRNGELRVLQASAV
ncbi:MAG TPA: hypothetical protein P5292_06340, partial [Bacteroidia bacterium]|nr:hypothetical protein [Bacteroidia bacterium]